jgi:hypothetical protein
MGNRKELTAEKLVINNVFHGFEFPNGTKGAGFTNITKQTTIGMTIEPKIVNQKANERFVFLCSMYTNFNNIPPIL